MISIELRYPIKAATWGLTGAINVTQLCVGCNGGHAVMSDEVLVRFIALTIKFDDPCEPL